MRHNDSICIKNDCCLGHFWISSFKFLHWYDSSIFVYFWQFSELYKSMLIGCKRHEIYIKVSWSSFLCNDWILSITICWSNPEPCTTFIALFPLWFSTNYNHWCSTIELLYFCTLKDNIWFRIQIKDPSILWDMLCLSPIEAIWSFFICLVVRVRLKNKFIEGDCSWS